MPPLPHPPGHQAGVGAEGQRPLVLRQGQSLPPGLQRLLGGKGEEDLPRGLPGPARGRAQPQPVWNGHRFVSTLLPATTVTFSTTAAPRVPLSPILLHWHPL